MRGLGRKGLSRRGKESGAEGCGADRRGCSDSVGERRGSESRVREDTVG